MQVVGSRGDVQPFVALGKILKDKYGHRVRLATHLIFQSFVEDNGLEFFSVGGDPVALMAFMVKNPKFIPSMESIRNGDTTKQRNQMFEIFKGCWRSCIETGDGIGNTRGTGWVEPKLESLSTGLALANFYTQSCTAIRCGCYHRKSSQLCPYPLR